MHAYIDIYVTATRECAHACAIIRRLICVRARVRRPQNHVSVGVLELSRVAGRMNELDRCSRSRPYGSTYFSYAFLSHSLTNIFFLLHRQIHANIGQIFDTQSFARARDFVYTNQPNQRGTANGWQLTGHRSPSPSCFYSGPAATFFPFSSDRFARCVSDCAKPVFCLMSVETQRHIHKRSK